METIRGRRLAIFVFVFPMLVIYSVFVMFPLIPEALISFQEHDGFISSGFVGVSNFLQVLTDKAFWNANLNNVIALLLSTGVGIPISLVLALLIDRQTSGMRRFIKVSIFLPSVLSVTIICQLWLAIYQPQWGLLGKILQAAGVGSNLDVVSDQTLAIYSAIIPFIWQYIGFNAVVFYTGIKSIPETYYEAALIDGAGFVRASISITIPLLQDIFKFLILTSMLGCMAQFAHINLITRGGPGDASRTVVYYLYNTAFNNMEFGKGSATALIFIFECLLITLLINKFTAKEPIQY